MSISTKTRKILWARAGGRCSFPECRRVLIEDASDLEDEAVVGDEAHIVSSRPDGPRADPAFQRDMLDHYSNLVLFCRIHHKLVDDQPLSYPRDRLLEIKRQHVEWVTATLLPADRERARDDEIYAEYVEEFVRRANLDDWNAWTSGIFSGGQPHIHRDDEQRLDRLSAWLFSRVWPGRYPRLERAFTNFRIVLRDFLNVFADHAETAGDIRTTKKFYQIREWDPERYHRLANDYEEHVALVEDLFLEVTRAGNHLCDVVREVLDRRFRRDEGVLIVTSGPCMDMSFKSHRVSYTVSEVSSSSLPYPGLDEFLTARTSRDFYFGPLRDDE